MKKCCVIGEALIDFIPTTKGCHLKDVNQFKKMAGGAPANVACSICRLGGQAKIVTQLGKDAFGDFLIETMQDCGIDVEDVFQTPQADTALAFVSLNCDGNRDFQFYRRTSADLLLQPSQVSQQTLEGCQILHFCSVDLVESEMKKTHQKLIDLALQKNCWVSFDPNLRLSLWNDSNKLKQTVHQFIPYSHILKISDDELEFLTGKTTIEEAWDQLFVGHVELVILTQGQHGASLYKKDKTHLFVKGRQIEVQDTTGAGDSFIGAFLYCLLENNNLLQECASLEKALKFSNDYAAYTATKHGALQVMATQQQLYDFQQSLID